jgi:HlyD family secretion protein
MVMLWINKVKKPLPWVLGLTVIALVLVMLGVKAYRDGKPARLQEELERLTVEAKQQEIAIAIQASGTVEPIQSVNISPKNPGRLSRLLVEQGDSVETGKILAIMENSELREQIAEAEANVQRAQSSLKELEARRQGEISQTKARLSQNQASLKGAEERIPREIEQNQEQLNSSISRFQLAQDRARRNKYLLEQGAISQDSYDEAMNEERSAKAALAEAKQRLEESKNTKSPEIDRLRAVIAETSATLTQQNNTLQEEIDRLKAEIKAAQARLRLYQVQLNDTLITAPFSGIVTQKYATEGAFVTPTTSASTTASATSSSILALASGLEIIAKVPEVDIGMLKPGQSVEIVADAYPDRTFRGKVKRIAPEAIVEQNVTSFEVTITILTGEDKLRSKMNVDVIFLGDKINNALVVPTVAIVTEEGKTGVMILGKDKQPEFKPVTVGITLEDQTQILQGLSPREKVFIDLPKTGNK